MSFKTLRGIHRGGSLPIKAWPSLVAPRILGGRGDSKKRAGGSDKSPGSSKKHLGGSEASWWVLGGSKKRLGGSVVAPRCVLVVQRSDLVTPRSIFLASWRLQDVS